MKPKHLEDFHGPHRASGTQRNYRDCPVCGSVAWKVYVDPESGKWLCFVCPRDGRGRVSVGGEAADLRRRLFMRDRGVPTFSAVDMPDNRKLPAEMAKRLSIQYNLPSPDSYYLRLGTGDLSGRVVFPYCDESGTIIYWNSRSVDGSLPKYKAMLGPKPLYIPNMVRHKVPRANFVLVVEGPFDAMSVHNRFGVDAVSLGGKTLASHLKKPFENYVAGRNVRIMLDRDALHAALQLKWVLEGFLYRSVISVLPVPAAKDPAATPDGPLMEALCLP